MKLIYWKILGFNGWLTYHVEPAKGNAWGQSVTSALNVRGGRQHGIPLQKLL
jgi:hypothetical protein